MRETQDPCYHVLPQAGEYGLLYSPYIPLGGWNAKTHHTGLAVIGNAPFRKERLTLKPLPRSKQDSPKAQTGASQS